MKGWGADGLKVFVSEGCFCVIGSGILVVLLHHFRGLP